MKTNEIMKSVSLTFNKVGFRLQKKSPEILVAAGVVGIVVSAVMACQATPKALKVAEKTQDDVERIQSAEDSGVTQAGETYTKEDARGDRMQVYAHTGFQYIRLYAPAVLLGAASITCILTSHKLMRKRNMALAAAARGSPVVLVDLDIVNPYFRSSDYRELLEKAGVQVIAPNFSHTNLDLPSLPAAIYSVFEFAGEVIIDVGGDEVGATALGRFSKQIAAAGYEMLYVVNKYRALTSSAAEAAMLLREIESDCRLQATGVVNNSHLKSETTKATILDSLAYAEETAKLLCIPLLFTTAPRYLAKDLQEIEYLYPIDVHVKTSWEDY